jgi:hypothetical protein
MQIKSTNQIYKQAPNGKRAGQQHWRAQTKPRAHYAHAHAEILSSRAEGRGRSAAHATHARNQTTRERLLIHSTKERLFIDRRIKGRWKHRIAPDELDLLLIDSTKRRFILFIDRPRGTGAGDISHLSPGEHVHGTSLSACFLAARLSANTV